LIESVAVRPRGGVRRLTAPWRGVHLSSRRWRVLGGLGLSLVSLGACVLVARHLTDASWPLDGARVSLVFLAGGLYLASFGFRAFGWQQLFPRRERPDGARCLASCGAAAASGVVLPFRLDYVVKIFTLRRLGGVRLGLKTIGVSIVALGMVDAVAMLPLAAYALAVSGPVLRAPMIVVVLFCIGCLVIIMLGQRVSRLPLVGRSDRLHAVYRRVADSTRFSRPTLVAGLLLLGCWTSRALGSTFLLSALGVRFSPALALLVLCVSAALVSRSPDASEKLSATFFETPSANSTPAVVPMPATAPPAVMGRIAVAALTQTTTSASVGEKRTPRAFSRKVLPRARDVQHPRSSRPATSVGREKRVLPATRR
jgi:hypothetical protein